MSAETWTIRQGEPKDAAVLAAFWRDQFVATFAHLYRPSDLAAFLAESYGEGQQSLQLRSRATEHRLAWRADALIGAIQLGPLGLPIDAGATPTLEVKRLYVDVEAKGAGLADALLSWAIARARERGAHALFLGVWRENARAHRFYARHGFRKVGEYLFAVGEARDEEDILRLDLAP